ncbi:MAG TPA: transposase [Isosphaeraceae bacterium]
MQRPAHGRLRRRVDFLRRQFLQRDGLPFADVLSSAGLVEAMATLLDPAQASREELDELYRARWNNELDLRSIKVVLQMDRLRCKAPGLVRKEIWAHVLAYNLIRTVTAQAAAGEGVPPRSISLKATLRVLEAFRPLIAARADPRRGAPGGALRAAAPGHRRAPGRRPARPVRAPHDQEGAEGLSKPGGRGERSNSRCSNKLVS